MLFTILPYSITCVNKWSSLVAFKEKKSRLLKKHFLFILNIIDEKRAFFLVQSKTKRSKNTKMSVGSKCFKKIKCNIFESYVWYNWVQCIPNRVHISRVSSNDEALTTLNSTFFQKVFLMGSLACKRSVSPKLYQKVEFLMI